ncbi:MAG: hypothetical protein AAGA58_19765, partial [Verrucomicrobiota bacterium]
TLVATFAAFLSIFLLKHSSQAAPFVIDFDRDESGNLLTAGTTDLRITDPYANLFSPGLGVLLSTENETTNPLNLYDSEDDDGADNDLERSPGTWAGGSEVSTVFDNLLIVNSNSTISIPNDHGIGGQMTLDFGLALLSFGFDFVDLDSSANATLILYSSATNSSVSIPFADFEEGSGSIHETPSVLFGDRHANSIRDITAAEIGLQSFDRVTFSLVSSGGIGTAFFDTVPEPNTGLTLLFSAMALIHFRPRRK